MEKFTPAQKEVQKQRDAYEKQASKDAKQQNTFLENVTNRGMDKQDVMRMDAAVEDKRLEDVQHAERDQWKRNESAEKAQLLVKWFNAEHSSTLTRNKVGENKFKLEGLIGDKKVEIISEGGSVTKGFVDGEEIPRELAQEIESKHWIVAMDRTNALRAAGESKKEV